MLQDEKQKHVNLRKAAESIGFYRTDCVCALGAPAILNSIANTKTVEKYEENKGIEAPLQNEKLHPKMEHSGAKIEAKIAPGGDLGPMQRAATGQAREATLHDGTWHLRNGQRKRKF